MSLSKEEIIVEIASYMHGYLKEGRLSIQPYLKDVNINLDSIKDLLKIRFLLHSETVSFVESLPNRLKRFKTTTIAHKETAHNEIRGRILWQDSIRKRFEAGNDQTIYVTSEQNRSYDTDENLVLKELLKTLEELLFVDNIMDTFENMTWGSGWKELGQIVRSSLYKNIYIQRVAFQSTTPKQIQRASQHRLPLYKEASRVLKNYHRLMRGDYSKEELTEMLHSTFIMTDNEDVLMELYWTVQLIKERTETGTYFLLTKGNAKVAQWKADDSIYTISHNTNGPIDLMFTISFDELETIDHPVIKQLITAKKWADTHSDFIFGNQYSRGLWSGRPDILIEKRKISTGELDSLVIGEVKNTNSISYAKEGLWELSEYLHLLRSSEAEFTTERLLVTGILCLGNIEVKEKHFNQLEIKTLHSNG